MSLLECLVGIALCALLLNPLLKTSADLIAKQIQHEKTHALISEADRALELIGRAIRMAGYRNLQSAAKKDAKNNPDVFIWIQKRTGYRGSDALSIRHELSSGLDFDCLGNELKVDRTQQGLAQQGFYVDRQASAPKGAKVNGGSLMCQSLDRQGRLQNTTLMNGVNSLLIEEVISPNSQASTGQKRYLVKLQMTDGALLQLDFERTFTTRNLL
jgi:hypothetical protein